MLQKVSRPHARFLVPDQASPALNIVYDIDVSGYAPLIRAYVSFTLSKLRFHRHHPEFNGLFEYEEYISLKNIDDPNEG